MLRLVGPVVCLARSCTSVDQNAEREVKKANRDLSNLLSNIESPLSRLDAVQKKYTELLGDMRRLDRDHAKNKKRADLLQKEKDHGRSELGKTVSMKEKLEKLCRELQKENKKMKVGRRTSGVFDCINLLTMRCAFRKSTRGWKRARRRAESISMRSSTVFSGKCRKS